VVVIAVLVKGLAFIGNGGELDEGVFKTLTIDAVLEIGVAEVIAKFAIEVGVPCILGITVLDVGGRNIAGETAVENCGFNLTIDLFC
jgi:hypothetical protein